MQTILVIRMLLKMKKYTGVQITEGLLCIAVVILISSHDFFMQSYVVAYVHVRTYVRIYVYIIIMSIINNPTFPVFDDIIISVFDGNTAICVFDGIVILAGPILAHCDQSTK